MTGPAAHRYAPVSDRCACGGIVVYYEDAVGEGCEIEGVPWTISDEERKELQRALIDASKRRR